MALTTSILTKVSATQTSASDLGTAKFPVEYSSVTSLGNGTASSPERRFLFASSYRRVNWMGSMRGAHK
jgi:hypothetical protein